MARSKPIAETEIEGLYRLPLAEFTAQRNRLAKMLRAIGDRDRAGLMGKLAKPSVAAWLVNQLFYDQRSGFDALLEAAAAQRRTVARGGPMSSAAGGQRREAMQALLEAARQQAERSGCGWTPALRQRVTRTLDALAAGSPDDGARPGRLTTDLAPPGFDALLGTAIAAPVARGAKTPRPSKPAPRQPSAAARRRLDAARWRVEIARKVLSAARRARTTARKALERAQSRAALAESRARAAEAKADLARKEAHARDIARRPARSAVDESERAMARAESTLQLESRKLGGATE